jgi:dTDP-4-dehydrorhamnose reductase
MKPITTDELDQLALRPLNGGLNQNKIKKDLKLVPPSIDDCLDAIIERGVI